MAGTLGEDVAPFSGISLEGCRAGGGQQLQPCEGHVECGQLWHHARVPGELAARALRLQLTAPDQALGSAGTRALPVGGRRLFPSAG